MKRIFSISILFFLCPVILLANPGLKEKLDKLLEEDFLKTSEVGISVYDLTDNKPLYNYQNNKLYRPASIQKLITVITGLSVLGPHHHFSTSLYYTGNIKNGILNGDLYVVGGLDSEFADHSMDGLVRLLSQSGIKTVHGKLIADVSMADSLYWGAGWSWDDAPYSFQPKISPLMLQKGYVEVYATPGKKDSVASITCVPASTYYTLENRTISYRSGEKSFEVTRDWMNNKNDILATGNVESAKRERITVANSTEFFMHTFIERAKDEGINLPQYLLGELPNDSSATFFSQLSHPFDLVLKRAMKNSDNLSAEAVLFNLAANQNPKKHLSRSDGVNAIGKLIKELGFKPEDYNLVDGCGVSLYNYVSPDLILGYLKYAYSQTLIFNELYPALPIAGVDGTLAGRMKESKAYNNVHAKTGSVTGVSSLAGYATASDGHKIAFVVINQNVMKNSLARSFQDKLCEAICE